MMSDFALSHGADYSDWDHQNVTLIHFLALTGAANPQAKRCEIEYLLCKGYSIDTPDDSGQSPFLNAVTNPLCTTAEGLEVWIQAGADVNLTDNDGRNGLQVLGQWLEHLKDHRYNNMTHNEYLRWLKTRVKTLLRLGCNPNHKDIYGCSPSFYMRHSSDRRLWDIWISALSELQMTHLVDLSGVDDAPHSPYAYPSGVCSRCARVTRWRISQNGEVNALYLKKKLRRVPKPTSEMNWTSDSENTDATSEYDFSDQEAASSEDDNDTDYDDVDGGVRLT